MNRLPLIFLYSVSAISLKAQISTFTIHGDVKNISLGKVYLTANNFEKKYYGKNHTIDSANISDGKFEIQRQIFDDKPYAYRFIIRSDSIRGVTDLVFIEPKDQNVIIDSINEHIAPYIPNSKIQYEMKCEFNPFFKSFISEVNVLNDYEENLFKTFGNDIPKEKLLQIDMRREKLSLKSDSLFFQYSIKHADSYVTFWKLIERFNNIGYRKKYSIIYDLLSGNMKNTFTGKLFQQDLNLAKLLALNSPFPKIKLKNLSLQTIQLDAKASANKYTLIDFWFSHCAPCIREFPLLKKLYDDYKMQGFKIIGISTDMKNDINAWKNIIKKKDINWIQYLDEDGKLSKKLGINSFPTNFLLNDKGKIIQKNITPEELKSLLTEVRN